MCTLKYLVKSYFHPAKLEESYARLSPRVYNKLRGLHFSESHNIICSNQVFAIINQFMKSATLPKSDMELHSIPSPKMNHIPSGNLR